ncbi:uncharacterized protein [Littorina saxatilis]|uniref:Tox-ART-HYD1 domain-containing protein n=1 Tax=Littorina saxatilis TaxID=31220 RepID=A0AAN9BU08_9CAEN
MSSYWHFYHYTSDRGLNGIKDSGIINNSSQEKNHAHFGIGCYGTSLPPWQGKERIAQNNWRDHGVYYIQNGKVNWAIEVKVPRSINMVRKVPWRGKRITRDILVHDGPVDLDDYEWRALRVSEDYDPNGEYRARSIPYTKGDNCRPKSPVRYSTDTHRYSFASPNSSVQYSTPTLTPSVRRAEEIRSPVTREAYRPSTPPRIYASSRYESPPPKQESSCTIL